MIDSIKTCNILSGKEWHDILERVKEEFVDVFYTPAYYQTWARHEDAEPCCFYARVESKYFIYPFFKKSIVGYDLDDDYQDIFTAYGYGGVLSNAQPGSIELSVFNELFNAWCTENKVVAEFIRENPLNNPGIRDAEQVHVRNNVYICPGNSYQVPDKAARQNINKALASGVTTEVDASLDTLDQFVALYQMSAQRLGMDAYYHFNRDYFDAVKERLAPHVSLLNARLDGKIISSILYFSYRGVGNCHLAASNFEYSQFRMNDLLFKAVIDYTIEMGNQSVCIGGGTSTRADDSLFQFKKKFGNFFKPVHVGKKVHKPEVYTYLVSEWERRNPGLVEAKQNYFLKYRIQ